MVEANKNNVNPLLLSAQKTARLLGLSRSMFYQLNSSGAIGPQPIRNLGRPMWDRREIEKWVEVRCPGRSEWDSKKY